MRKTIVFALFLLLPSLAFAQSAITLNPSSIRQYTTEWNLQITGSNLAGSVETHVLFTNTSTTDEILALSATSTQVIVQAPGDITASPGTWQVTVKAIDSTGTRLIGPATLTVTALVTQSPPLINTPEVVTAEATSPSGANVTWDVSVLSFADPNNPPTATCSPSSGSLFSLGTHTVTCSATDAFGTGTASFLCIVTDNTPPVVTVPSDIFVTSTDGNPVAVTYTASATDNLDGSITPTCKPASGSLFPVGTTQVTCTAIDKHANYGFGFFNVTVEPAGRPIITVPADITAEATGPNGAAVDYDVSVNPPDATLVCTPASGSTFALGTTTVNCTATKTTGETSTASFTVTVVDTTPPAFTVSPDPPIFAEATEPTGALVTYTVTATDLVDGPVTPVTCTPLSGSHFALDVDTTVQCTATDSHGNLGTASFIVRVVDTTPPTLHLPADFTVSADANCMATITYTATATDIVDVTDTVTCTPASGFVSGLGTTTVNCTSTDAHGNTATGSFHVTVADTTPPTITSISATPNNLWPDNHRMVDVVVAATAADNCDPSPTLRIVSVAANQPINGPGDGNTNPDYIITGNLTLQLRAERTGSQDRVYTITVAATDFSGNTSTATTTVSVAQTSNGNHGRAAGH
ncbi:MAG TPA: HYR domain-containing protein [Thermoanaerobaculia bacterium]|nr:HYR domain-containing protein [Thermoanaerobaculia bacterium]